ncbi:endonuclease 8-like 3 [Lineus longissimus]|uniref:endonuclease 8-like 3 n=1 Tax=Lineus longissimus TaxID=88925 RepID=UPI002B4F0579
MVEGPGCKLKGEKMKGRLKGKVVKRVSGNVVEKENKVKKNPDVMNRYSEFIGRKLDDVQTLGKELFMYFGDKCFRVHFLMDGSFRVNNQVLDNDPSNTNSEAMLLEIGEDKVAFYKCSVDIRLSADCRSKFDRLHSLDICSSTFNHQRAVQTFMEQENRLVCDVLLDQVILPGVGNIIKNEALFDSGIRPSSRVKQLNEALVSHLIRMTRDFSMIFYKCRKTGESLRKYEKVYSRQTCRQCRGKITITRMGEDSARMTHYCPQCQTNNPKDARTLPTKNSLLGWVTSGQNQPMSMEWTCTACTLINQGSATACSACEGKKPHVEPKAIQVPILKPVPLITNSNNNTSSSRRTTNRTIKTNKRKGDPIPSSPTKRLRSDVAFFGSKSAGSGALSSKPVSLGNSLPTIKSDNVVNGNESAVIDLSDSDNVGTSGDPQAPPGKTGADKRAVYVNCSINSDGSNISGSNENISRSTSVDSDVTSRESNSELSKMNNTRRNAVNHTVNLTTKSNNERNYTSVKSRSGNSSVNTNSQPQADPGANKSKIPLCPKHNMKCALREVRKEGANLGRMFFCCPLPRGKQCFIFRWADEEFPICEGHGKKCVLRTVLKEGQNNRRKFFACSVGRKKQCKFFQWADEYND